MPPAQGQSQGGGDNSLAALWLTLGLFVACGFIWHFFSTQIVQAVFVTRRYEAEFLSWFLPASWSTQLTNVIAFVSTAKASGYENITFPQVISVSNAVGIYMRYPVIAILILLSIMLLKANPISKYKKVYDMKRLMMEQLSLWSQVVPVSKLSLVEADLDKGPWAMAMQPMSFAKKYNLLEVEQIQRGESRLASKAILIANVNVDEARKVFALQVGSYWQGPQKLPMPTRALFAIFAAKIAGDRDGAVNLLKQIASSADKPDLNFSNVDTLLQKHMNNKIVQSLCSRHAFVLTVMASMLEVSRTDGVQASADFLWLKPKDRRLWLMLNSIGRQTPFAEISGPFAHWLAEKEMGKRLNVPMIEEAVTGLVAAIKEMIYMPDKTDD